MTGEIGSLRCKRKTRADGAAPSSGRAASKHPRMIGGVRVESEGGGCSL